MRRAGRAGAWITASAMTLAVLLSLALIWGHVPLQAADIFQGAATQASAQARAADMDQTAERLGGLLRSGLACASQAAALLESASTKGATWSTAANALAHIQAPLDNCLDQHIGLEQVFALTSTTDAAKAAALRSDREPRLGPLDQRYLAQLQEAGSTQTASYALPPGGVGGSKDGLDQIVPVRGAGLNTLLVLRYRLPRAVQDRQIPASALAQPLQLADDRSSSTGLAIRGTRGLRIVPAGPPDRPWLLSGLALAQLLLGASGLYWMSRAQRQYQGALLGQIVELKEADRKLQAEAAEHAKAERQLELEIAFRRDIEDSVNVGLRVIDNSGRLTAVNRAFCALSGWPKAQLLDSRPPYPFWPADELASHQEHLASIMSDQMLGQSYQVSFVRPDGERWTAEVRASALGSGAGWILACTDISQDIENQERMAALYENVRQQSDLHLLAEWAGEFLHKMSNHAGACVNACEGMRKFLANGRTDMLAEGAELASRAANDMHAVIERFRPRLRAEPAFEATQLWDVAADSLAQQSGHAAGRNIRLVNIVSTDLPPQRLDRQALLEVLINLINNGILAMANTPLSNRMLILESVLDEDRAMVELHVRDRGCGIAPELRDKVFEQGYTTRERGTGWGLFMSRQWVERMAGKLVIANTSRNGTDMVITLPFKPEPVSVDDV